MAPSGGFGVGTSAPTNTGEFEAGGGGWYGASEAGNGGGGSGYISLFSLSGSYPGGLNQGDGKVIITRTT